MTQFYITTFRYNSKALLAQLFLFCPPDGGVVLINWVGERWELDLLGVEADPLSAHNDWTLCVLSNSKAFSSSSSKGNIRRSHDVWGCQKTKDMMLLRCHRVVYVYVSKYHLIKIQKVIQIQKCSFEMGWTSSVKFDIKIKIVTSAFFTTHCSNPM